MTKLLWAAVLLLVSADPGFAQGRDTAFAVHKLFAQKRGSGQQAAATGASLVTEAATLNGAIKGSLAGAAPIVLGLNQAAHYSVANEHAVLGLYTAGFPLPAEVRRKLRRKHFHRTVKDVSNTLP